MNIPLILWFLFTAVASFTAGYLWTRRHQEDDFMEGFQMGFKVADSNSQNSPLKRNDR